jgi:colanic acid/amylovoran biosynthesis protein
VLVSRYENQFSLLAHRRSDTTAVDGLPNVEVCRKAFRSAVYDRLASPRTRDAWLKSRSQEHDLFVYVGGSTFIEGLSLAPWRRQRDTYLSLPIPYHLLGLNFGPYRSEEFVDLARSIFANAEAVCFRDTASYQRFKDIPSTRVAADIGFAVDPTRGTAGGGSSAVISVVEMKHRTTPSLRLAYDELIVGLTESLVRDGHHVVHASFCEFEGDDAAIDRISKRLDPAVRRDVERFAYHGDLDSGLELLARSSLVVGTRFHAVVLALAFNRPVLPIAYSEKTTQLLADIGFAGPVITFDTINNFEAARFDLHSLGTTDVSAQRQIAQRQFESLDDLLVRRQPASGEPSPETPATG